MTTDPDTTDAQLKTQLRNAGLVVANIGPATLDLAREWVAGARRLRELVDRSLGPGVGPVTTFTHPVKPQIKDTEK